VLAFAGIGDPARFFRTLNASGVDVGRARTFADHHRFSQRELNALLADARADGLTLATTEKDFARLGGVTEARDIVAFKVTLRFADDQNLRKFLARRLFKAREKKFRSVNDV